MGAESPGVKRVSMGGSGWVGSLMDPDWGEVTRESPLGDSLEDPLGSSWGDP